MTAAVAERPVEPKTSVSGGGNRIIPPIFVGLSMSDGGRDDGKRKDGDDK